MRNKCRNKLLALLSLILGLAQLLLVVSSWLVAAAFPQVGIRSLLSSEGVRWFFGQFVNNLACQLLVWTVLLSLAWGALTRSGLLAQTARLHSKECHLSYRERIALLMVGVEVLLVVGVMLLLTMVPHAVLLNVTGGLYSGAFPASVIPVLSFTMVLTGVTYGSLCGRLNSVTQVCNAMSAGVRDTADWWLPLVLAVQLSESVRFVFS